MSVVNEEARAAGQDGRNRPEAEQVLARVAELEAEVGQLREALATRQQIGFATGVLAARLDLGPERAWRLMVRLSAHTNLKVRVVARLLATGCIDELAPEDRATAEQLNQHLPAEVRLHLPG